MMDYFILVINKDEHITSSEFALNTMVLVRIVEWRWTFIAFAEN